MWQLFIAIFISLPVIHNGKRVEMKIVDEPTNLGMTFNQNEDYRSSKTLEMRVMPANFSGPPHLKVLLGKCFTKIGTEYKYEFCPFSNITQHEQSLRWNPYSGILGTWQEWYIENNTFVYMHMLEGDSCGALTRQTKVFLKCSNRTYIGDVTEPATCKYHMDFLTPHVCHPHSLLVYPTLSHELQRKWDILEGQMANEEYTKKGYDKQLREIFIEAGLVKSQEQLEDMSKQVKEKVEAEEQEKLDEKGNFISLDTCKEEYKSLLNEVETLRAIVEVYKSNSTVHSDD